MQPLAGEERDTIRRGHKRAHAGERESERELFFLIVHHLLHIEIYVHVGGTVRGMVFPSRDTFGGVWFAMIAIPQRKTPARLNLPTGL